MHWNLQTDVLALDIAWLHISLIADEINHLFVEHFVYPSTCRCLSSVPANFLLSKILHCIGHLSIIEVN